MSTKERAPASKSRAKAPSADAPRALAAPAAGGEALDGVPAPNPLDPLGVSKATLDVFASLFAQPAALLEHQMKLASAMFDVASGAFVPASEPAKPAIEPAPGDNRFKHAAWSQNPFFDAMKQGYLLATKAVLDSVDASGADDATKRRVKFFAKQFCDAMSPTNFALLNPAVIEETLKSGGTNLQRGAEHVLEDLRDNDGRPALVDKAAFTVGRNVATSPGAVVYRNDLIELIQYAPTTETAYSRPLVIVPPWINKFYILDLQPANSFIKFAVDAGMTVFVVSWRNPGPEQGRLSWEDYLERGPLTAARVAASIAESDDVNLIGYCIGGTLSAEMLAYLARTGEKLVRAVTFFAALVDFEEAGEIKNFLTPETLGFIEGKMREKGVFDASDMADTFSMLRANDLIWNVAVNRYLLGKDAPAFDLLYWNGDATRLPAEMHAYYLRNMYLENRLSAPNALSFRGVPIDLREVRNDAYVVATAEDHIAPWRSVYKMTQLFSGDVRFRLGHSGHIAGVINPPGSGKGHYWEGDRMPAAPDAWLASAEKKSGSWWPDWSAWLAERSGERVAARAPGSKRFPPLVPAPGTYVLEKA